MNKPLILVVEDDPSVRNLITTTLKTNDYRYVVAPNGSAAIMEATSHNPEIILLDLGLPDMDGIEILKKIREWSAVPVIVVSARGEESDKVEALDLGADDYISKPFNPLELVARVKAVLRRYQPPVQTPASSVTEQHGNFVEYPDLIVNLTNYSVIYNGHSIELPPKELELLYFLASSPNQVFTREQLLDHIWGYEYIGDTRTVDVHIKRLREKIKGNDKWALTTVWGIGYKFEVKR